jgi:hypothetical protein
MDPFPRSNSAPVGPVAYQRGHTYQYSTLAAARGHGSGCGLASMPPPLPLRQPGTHALSPRRKHNRGTPGTLMQQVQAPGRTSSAGKLSAGER